MKRDTCQASARLSLRPVVSGRHAEPGPVLKWTIFVGSTSRLRFTHKRLYWQTWLNVSHWFESRRHLVVWKAWETSQQWKQERCFKSVGSRITGRPIAVMTDPEGCFRERHFREWLAINIIWDPLPGEEAWRIRVLGNALDVTKNYATRAASCAPHATSCEDMLDKSTEARNEIHRRKDY